MVGRGEVDQAGDRRRVAVDDDVADGRVAVDDQPGGGGVPQRGELVLHALHVPPERARARRPAERRPEPGLGDGAGRRRQPRQRDARGPGGVHAHPGRRVVVAGQEGAHRLEAGARGPLQRAARQVAHQAPDRPARGEPAPAGERVQGPRGGEAGGGQAPEEACAPRPRPAGRRHAG